MNGLCVLYGVQRNLGETMHCANIVFELCRAPIDEGKQRAARLQSVDKACILSVKSCQYQEKTLVTSGDVAFVPRPCRIGVVM